MPPACPIHGPGVVPEWDSQSCLDGWAVRYMRQWQRRRGKEPQGCMRARGAAVPRARAPDAPGNG